MNEYFNAIESTIELPIPGGLGVRKLSPGQSFYGPAYYDRFMQQGLLAKAQASRGSTRGYVSSTDVGAANATVSDSTAPYRYKKNNTTGLSSQNQLKFVMYMGLDTEVGDNVLVLYYFYCYHAAPNMPSHVIPRYEPLVTGWSFPTWAALPSNFYSLDPIEQMSALMQTA